MRFETNAGSNRITYEINMFQELKGKKNQEITAERLDKLLQPTFRDENGTYRTPSASVWPFKETGIQYIKDNLAKYDTDKSGGISKDEFQQLKADLIAHDNAASKKDDFFSIKVVG
jgi:hypothetical protein